jgi:energy-converting hydrogenase A subunit R
MGHKAKLTPGATELISKLKSQGWHVFCISTSYEQYAYPITQRLGIPGKNVACTSFPLVRIHQLLGHNEFVLLEQAEHEIVKLKPFTNDTEIRSYLDGFHGQRLPQTSSGRLIGLVKPVGGRRKVEALDNFTTGMGEPLSGWTVVGDSITDFKMLQAVNKSRGLAIAFNANEYALKYASMSLASVRLDDLWIVLEAWKKGARLLAQEAVTERQKLGGAADRKWFH